MDGVTERCARLVHRARTAPNALRFRDAVRVARCIGMELERVTGSHHIFVHPGARLVANLQRTKGGSAKGYQVRQLVRIHDTLTEGDPHHAQPR